MEQEISQELQAVLDNVREWQGNDKENRSFVLLIMDEAKEEAIAIERGKKGRVAQLYRATCSDETSVLHLVVGEPAENGFIKWLKKKIWQ